MSSTERGLFLALLSAAPALCCLIATGVFLHRLESTTRPPAPADPKALQQEKDLDLKRVRIAQLEGEIARYRSAMEDASARTRARKDAKAQQQVSGALLSSLRSRHKVLTQRLAEEEARSKILAETGSDLARLRIAEKELEDQLAAAMAEQKKLIAVRNAAHVRKKNQEKTYSVTALSGGSSLLIRRALFVECMHDGIVIQPQGRQLSTTPGPSDQQAFLSAAAATGYVVFLIRPDGYESFHRYRALAQLPGHGTGNRIDIGFEPVDDDWVLVYPDRQKEVTHHVASGGN